MTVVKLQIEPADGPPFQRVFDQDSMIIGRASDSDLALADPFLSRHHARLFTQGPKLLIEDLGSRNGTQLNGHPVLQPTSVTPGDVVTVSGSTISIYDDSSEDTQDPGSDIGATILRPASEMLKDVSTVTSPDLVHGEDALRNYASRLKLINEIHEVLSTSIEVDELLKMILDRAFDQLNPEQGVIFLRDGKDFERATQRSKSKTDDEIPLSRALTEEVCNKGMAALVLDTATDIRFAAAQSIITSGLRSLIAAPFHDRGETLGMIVLCSKAAVREFDREDLELLVSLASIAALKLRNATLTEEALQRQKMEQDLALARRIQESLLPKQLPMFEGWELYAQNLPSRGVSGDYYSVFSRRDDSECVLMITDVSGKGVPASLLTHTLEALSAAPIENGLPTDQVCLQVSRRLHRRSPPEKYATGFLIAIEVETGTIQYTNAGHNPALLVRSSGYTELLESSGMPLGLVPNSEYTADTPASGPLASGDLLMLYTDGITEAEDPNDEEYGLDRLRDLLVANRKAPLPQISELLNADLDRFTRSAPPTDDRTIIMFRRR